MTAATGFKASHPAIRAYAQRHGIEPSTFRSDGRVTLSFDRRYRLMLRPGPDGRIIISSRLLDLSDLAPSARDDILVRLGTAAGGLLRDHGPGLCIDEAQGSLLLMELAPATVDVLALEERLGQFVNVLAFWVRVCAREAGGGRPPGGSFH